MRSSKALWRTVGLVSLAATLLLFGGFVYAVNDLLNPAGGGRGAASEQSPAPAPASPDANRYIIAALGDSLTKGIGDDTGQGYVKMTAGLLEKRTGKPVAIVNNLAIGGMRADELAEALENDKGYRRTLEQANVILLTIGGNDLFAFARGGSGGTAAADTIDPKRAEALMGEGLKRLDAVFSRIAAINPEARLVYVGLYNPFFDIPELRQGSVQVHMWNAAAQDMLLKLPGGTLVPTADLFERDILNYLSPDHFHPNQAGYARIAERVVQALT